MERAVGSVLYLGARFSSLFIHNAVVRLMCYWAASRTEVGRLHPA